MGLGGYEFVNGHILKHVANSIEKGSKWEIHFFKVLSYLKVIEYLKLLNESILDHTYP